MTEKRSAFEANASVDNRNQCGTNRAPARMNARSASRFKICRWKHRAGSIPASGTSKHAGCSEVSAVRNFSAFRSRSAFSKAVVPQMTKPTEFWRWEVWSETAPRKRIKTRHHMTREDAIARDPTSTPIPGTLEVRNLPETDEEHRRMFTHSINSRGPR